MIDGPRLSIIVVSYNTCEITLECLRSVRAETRTTPYELIVVDNASPDGSAEAIAREFPDVTLFARGDNLGFGGANNFAAGQARGEFLLLLNPDTVVLDGAIDRLMAFADERPAAGIWGGRTLFGDRSLNPSSCWRGMSLWGLFARGAGLSTTFPGNPLFNSDAYGGWRRDTVREVDTVSGCFLLIRRDLWERLGGFDPAFFMYGEEADLCLRARQAGARPTFTPDATIIHYGGRSETVPADKLERLMRAKMTLASKHWTPFRRSLAGLLLRMISGSRLIGYAAAARLLGRRGYSENARVWQQVWDRRGEWLKGYR
jgi:GT2 family glycosyltransferase